MLSDIAHGLAIAGIVFLNYLIYGFVLYGIGIFISFVLYAYSDLEDEVVDTAVRVTVFTAFALVAVLMALYAADVFRLIPLP